MFLLSLLCAGLVVVYVDARIKLNHAYRSPSFGCKTRQCLDHYYRGIERRANMSIIFLDIDNLKTLNDLHGEAEANKLISAAFADFRENLYQYFSGDELVIPCRSKQAQAIARKLDKALYEQGLSASWAIAPLTGKTVQDAILPAITEVKRIKRSKKLER